MADFGDLGRAESEEQFQRALARQIARWAERDKESLTHCLECGCEIPEARRQAVPGCKYCVQCQEARDA